MKKCLVLLSGGLDSLLAVKIMQEQGFDVLAMHCILPFSKRVVKNVEEFCKKNKVKLKVVDFSQGDLLKKYIQVMKKPCYGWGKGVNACIDCRLLVLNQGKKIAKEKGIDLIVSGEVLGERPMSQHKKAIDIVEKESGLKGKLLRPLSAKLLEETGVEKKGIVEREKLYSIQGRQRQKQIKLAEKFKINYPNPSGGCLMCEKDFINRFKHVFQRGLKDEEVKLIGIGRHFLINNKWVVLSRNEEESKIMGKTKKGFIYIPDFPAPTGICLDKPDKKTEEKIIELILAYSKFKSKKTRKDFEKYKL